ncbi:DNA ligase 4 [Mycetomoellerius zeteki]|uniref:DNA ligase 4 n=1 Tax=Mycetomoellerius zeteki TaxID=64791 RepID=UPI00084ECC00|nr:PREDICTED: DNA ligase 4 [Trachymyrmex zeteki]XP_018312221.1 PREDICTED: DNA ligase 4 [Trachymyrmex zeteki]
MAIALEAKIEFKQLCDTLEDVAKTHDVKKKEQILQTFIDKCRNVGDKLKIEYSESDVSLYPILRLILPDLERQRGPHNLKQVSLANLYAHVYGFAKNSDSYKKLANYRDLPSSGKFIGNDFADRAYCVLNKKLPRISTGFTIARINEFLDSISERNTNVTRQQKVETFRVLFRQITGFEMKWMTRIILKDLRLGIGTQRILHIYHPDANDKSLVTNDLREICNQLHNPKIKLKKCGIQIFSHFKPMLLERCNIENISELFRDNDLYYVQTKYDGERSQLHMKNGKFKYLTRRGYDITNKYGYGETGSSGFLTAVFTRCLNPNCHSFILDGELMAWHKEKKIFSTKGMNLDVKNLSASSHHQPCFVAFDVILHNDILLVDTPYKDRLKLLNNIFTEEEGSLIVCQSTLISNREELLKEFNTCLRNNEEGLVIKKCNMKYKPNIRDGNGCYKIKAEYSDNLVQDIDLIILGGYYGEGKYIGIIKSFMMGVAAPANKGENPSQFFSIVSVSTGIGDETLRHLQTKLAPYWIKERPENIMGPKGNQPDMWIHPEHSIILTIRATEMIRSNKYPIGYGLRFPRVMNVRMDKPWYSPCTTLELLSLAKDGGIIQKLTKQEATLHDIDQVPVSKLQKIASRSKSIEHNMCDKRVVPLTRLLDGKEICVINGTDELSKEQIEEILQQHSAKIVQNPINTTFCVIVGNNRTIRGKEVVNSGKYDVVTLDWVKRINTNINRSDWTSLIDFLPWELLCSRNITRHQVRENYDEYYDSFVVDADEESLKRSFGKIAKPIIFELTGNPFTSEQEKEMDKELFGSTSPYSLFRDIIGFFENQSCNAKFKFRFMSGTIKDNIDSSVTHVFVEDNEKNVIMRNMKAYEQISTKIVKCTWIEECFRNGRICEITDYLTSKRE